MQQILLKTVGAYKKRYTYRDVRPTEVYVKRKLTVGGNLEI